MMRCGRWVCVAGLALTTAWLASDGPVSAQPFIINPEGALEPTGAGAVILPSRELTQALDRARTLLEQSNYAAAVKLLQAVLDQPEDAFTSRDMGRSLKDEVLTIFAEMPSEGRESYELLFGITARELLNEALEQRDREQIAEVMRRFFHTQAGYEAAYRLGTELLDQSHPLAAAIILERLRGLPEAARAWEPMLTLKTAVAWSRAGAPQKSVELLGQLRQENPNGRIHVGGRDVALFRRQDQALAWLAQTLGVEPEDIAPLAENWLMPGGSATRNAAAVPLNPVGAPLWRISTLEGLPLDADADVNRKRINLIEEELRRLVDQQREDGRPAIAALSPLAVGDTVVFRTLNGLSAVDRRSGQLRWRSVLVDPTLQQLFAQGLVDDEHGETSSLTAFLSQRVLQDQTGGLLSSDGHFVYAIEDVGYAGYSAATRGAVNPLGPQATNKLVAYEAAGGRFRWEIGGARNDHPLDFAGHDFLGPPLPLDGRLYCLAEYSGEIRLLVLEPRPERRTVEAVWVQPLVAPTAFGVNPARRTAGLTPSAVDGILICPTGCGTVLAVDLERRQLLWGHQYSSTVTYDPRMRQRVFGRFAEPEVPLEDDGDHWLDSLPVVAEGRVLLTPRDSRELHCLDLTDGRAVWTKPRGLGLFVAGVHQGTVFVVGRTQIEAWKLSDGEPAWSEPLMIPTPSGRGVRAEGYYHLPLTTGEIATIDLTVGRIIARSRLPDNHVPGNLVTVQGMLIGQSGDSLFALTPLQQFEQQLAEALRQDGDDAHALTLRGQLRLHRGEEQRGLNDLRRGLELRADAEIKSVLVTILLDGLRNDFARYRRTAEEVQELIEETPRRAEFLRVYGSGLREAGEHEAALQCFLKLTRSDDAEPTLERVSSVLTARSDRLVRAQLLNLYQNATPEEQARITRRLREHLAVTERSGEKLRRRLGFFDGLPVAETIRRRLIETWPDDGQPLELELHLLALRKATDPDHAAFATARLVQLWLAHADAAAALPLIDELATNWTDRVCLDEKTGRQLADEWRKEPEVAAELERPSPWPVGLVEARRIERGTNARNFAVDVLANAGPALQGWSFRIDQSRQSLTAFDALGRQRWRVALPRGDRTPNQDFRFLAAPYGYYLVIHGHLLVMAMGDTLVAIDALSNPSDPSILWEQPLADPLPVNAAVRGLIVRGAILPNGRPRIITTDNAGRLFGTLGAVTGDLVSYQIGTKLHACEPLTGETLWIRQDVPRSGELDAAEQAVLVYSSDSDQAFVLRAADGELVTTRVVPPNRERLWLEGSLLVTWREVGGRRQLECLDVPSGETRWRQDFAPGAQPSVVANDEVAVLEPSGRFVVLNLADGAKRLRQTVQPEESLERITVLRSPEQYLLVASRPVLPRNNVRVIGFDNSLPVDGFAYGLDRGTGERVWMQPIERLALDPSQPEALPVIVFAARTLGQRQVPPQGPLMQNTVSVLVLDKRTGQILHEDKRSATAGAMQLEADPETATITVNFFTWRVELKFTGPPEPPPPPAEPTDS